MSHISLSFANTTAFLIIDREGSAVNLLDEAALDELTACLDELVSEPHVTGLLIRSGKLDHFATGADPSKFSSARGERLDRIITQGQALFNRIADLPFPTVAAIHGACLGGGYELALACDWRVAADASSTEIGLPQTRIGLLPAWGGSTRLPDLLGLQDALPVILYGKRYSAAEARRMGLVDEIVPLEYLKVHALTFLAKGNRDHVHNPIVNNQPVSALIRAQARKELLRKTRGHYPAPEAALEVAVASVVRSRAQSQQAERDAIVRLVALPETAGLIRHFLIRERAEKHCHSPAEPREICRAAVIGAGAMGSGIAHRTSSCGIATILQDITPEALAHGMDAISALYADEEKLQAVRGLDRIHPACGKIPLKNVDLIIETTAGELEDVKEILTDLATRCRPDTLLATHTSTLPIRELAACIPNPERVVGLHFLHPIRSAQLVEIVRTDHITDEILATAVAFVRRLGKLPIVVRDSPGFLVNRLLMPYLVKAASLFEEGGDPDEIDNAMLDFGMPIGPLRLLDEIGLDTSLCIARNLAAAFPGRMEIPGVVEKLLQAGYTGRKGGSGFYVYDNAAPAVNAEVIAFQTGTEPTPPDTPSILANLIMAEAKLCLAEGVAESADDIDLAAILGVGYPPFRSDSLGN